MAQTTISGLNYDAVLGSEDYKTYRQTLESEIINRFKLICGKYSSDSEFKSGIVDVLNPAGITTSQTGRPLRVFVSSTDSLKINIESGTAISKNGTVLSHTYNQYDAFALDTGVLVSGRTYVIVLEASVDYQAGSSQLNDYQELQYSQDVVYTSVVSYLYSSSFTVSDTQVPIAIVTVMDSGTGQVLSIDLSQTTYSFNRPWFSVVDTEHRSQIGSGTVTEKNPHATSVNDLTLPGGVGVFQGLTGQGMVISRDAIVNKMVGATICKDEISASIISVDGSGLITKGSPYSKAGALYCTLTKIPVRLGSVYDSKTPANAIAAELLPGTNMVVFGPNENITSDQTIIVEYSVAYALLPDPNPTSNFLTFSNPSGYENIIAGGFTYATVQDPTISLEGLGPFARKYMVYLNAEGILTSYPEVLVPAQSALISPSGSFTPSYPARIAVGLTNTTSNPALSVTVEVHGTIEGSSTPTYETLVFSPSTGFVDQGPSPSPVYDLPGQLLFTDNKFTDVTSIAVTASNAGTSPMLQVWAEIEPGTSPEINDFLSVAEISWNGYGVAAVKDMRPIRKYWTPVKYHLFAEGESELDSIRMLSYLQTPALLTNPSVHLFTEDFEDLKFFDNHKGYTEPTTASGVIELNSSSLLQGGDTITLTTFPSKVLTATSGDPVNPGEFKVGSLLDVISLAEIRTNLINAINDTAFASNVTATASTTNSAIINLVLATPTGVLANNIAITCSNPTAATIFGWRYAMDGYGECYLARPTIGLDSKVIPAGSDLNPYKYPYRSRYRSRAYALPDAFGVQTTFAIQVHGEDRYADLSLRIRGSTQTNAKQWTAWALASSAPAGNRGLYVYTFGEAVHKVQIELYGKARGISVYMIRS